MKERKESNSLCPTSAHSGSMMKEREETILEGHKNTVHMQDAIV